jgi:hypothetical protein
MSRTHLTRPHRVPGAEPESTGQGNEQVMVKTSMPTEAR